MARGKRRKGLSEKGMRASFDQRVIEVAPIRQEHSGKGARVLVLV